MARSPQSYQAAGVTPVSSELFSDVLVWMQQALQKGSDCNEIRFQTYLIFFFILCCLLLVNICMYVCMYILERHLQQSIKISRQVLLLLLSF